MLLTDYLKDLPTVWDSTPVMSWDDVEHVFRNPDDPNEILQASISLCSGYEKIDPAHTDLIASTPLSAWILGEMFFYNVLKPSPLTMHKAIMKAEQIAAENTAIPEIAALNEQGLARLYSDQLANVMTGMSHAEKFLELTEPHRWYSVDFPIAKYVLHAAVECANGPIGPIGERVMTKYDARLSQAIEDLTKTQPHLTRAWLPLLSIWRAKHPD